MNQKQMFYAESRKIGEADQLFLEFVDDGMTAKELSENIKRHPALWSRYAGWLEILPAA